MSEICIVTTFQREELLFLCLEAIRRDDPDIPIIVFSDRAATSDDLTKTCDIFKAHLRIREQHNRYGNSWNLLMAATWAVQQAEIVHFIEDDTIVHRGYFEWARNTLLSTAPKTLGTQIEAAAYACVCGHIGSPHQVNWYTSPCASWNSDYLKIALGHVTPGYLQAETREEMLRVIDTDIFPKSKFKRGGSEQDGFFLRCIEAHGWRTAFPPDPLATHFGFFGYNRPPEVKRPEGEFPQRVQFCRDLLANYRRRVELFGKSTTDKEMGVAK